MLAVIVLPGLLFAQNGSLAGKVTDIESGLPIQYANVILRPKLDTFLLLGAITDEKGQFEITDIPRGNYLLKASFVGYVQYVLDSLQIDVARLNLGVIGLSVAEENVGEVTVNSTRAGIRYGVDRKIVDASSFPGAEKAIDLLENMPSLQVDMDGRLTYRGDGTFMVYINGRPEPNGEEKLRQIPAERIRYIEIISNPTAKYDAEGTAGIIQVTLKRNRLEGYAINTSFKTSTLGSVEWLFSVDQKGPRGGWYIQGQANNDVLRKMDVTTIQTIRSGENTFSTFSDLVKKERQNNSFMEFGFNYDLSDKDYIDFMLSADPIRRSNVYTDEGSYTEVETAFSQELNRETYDFDSRFEMYYRYLRSVLSYEHAFNEDRSHLLSASVDYSTYLQPLEESKIDTKVFPDRMERIGYLAREYNEEILEARLSYKNRLSARSTFETGSEINLDHIPKLTSESGNFYEKRSLRPFADEHPEQEVDFKQNIYAAFATFESKLGKLEYKLGLRLEYTDRHSNFTYSNENGTEMREPAQKNFTDFFPSVHVVYNFSDENQLSVNYSRRINRADYWELVPLKRYESPYLYYTGNGNLIPSYVDAYELGYMRSWGDDYISLEIFARNTDNLIQSYYYTGGQNNITWTKENVGSSLSAGAEFSTGVDVFSWWNANLASSLYSYRLKIDMENDQQSRESLRGDIQFNNTFRMGKTATLRYQFSYLSSIFGAQVERDGYALSNLVLRKSFLKRKWTAELGWANVFDSIRYKTTTKGDQGKLDVESSFHRSPYLTFKISYRFNNQN